MSGYSNYGLQINTFIIVASKITFIIYASKKAIKDGTTTLQKLFGLNSHLLGWCDKCWGVSKSCVSKTACSTHKTRYSTVFNAENQLPLFTNCFFQSVCKCLTIYHFLRGAFYSERNWMLKALDFFFFFTQNTHSLCKLSITHTHRNSMNSQISNN